MALLALDFWIFFYSCVKISSRNEYDKSSYHLTDRQCHFCRTESCICENCIQLYCLKVLWTK